MRRRLPVLIVVLVLGTASAAHAQLVVWDALAWAKDRVLNTLQDTIIEVQQGLNEALFIVNRRLPTWTSIAHYAVSRDDTPSWKILDYFSPEVVFFARPFHYALSYGDGAEEGFASVAMPRTDAGLLLGEDVSPEASAYLQTQLAGLDLTDAVLVRSTAASGALRFAGRQEDDAIALLQGDVLNEDDQEQAMNAVLSTLTAQSLIEARNAQSAITLQTALVELLTLDAKRDREAHTAALNAQLRALSAPRDTTLDGTADILSRWRLP